MSIVERIKFLAEPLGFNVKQLEQELGFANGSIRRWDSNSPSADKLYKLANFLNTTCEFLLTGNNYSVLVMSPNDAEWLSLIHELPTSAQYEFLGEIKGYLKRMNEESGKKVPNSPEELEQRFPPVDVPEMKAK